MTYAFRDIPADPHDVVRDRLAELDFRRLREPMPDPRPHVPARPTGPALSWLAGHLAALGGFLGFCAVVLVIWTGVPTP